MAFTIFSIIFPVGIIITTWALICKWKGDDNFSPIGDLLRLIFAKKRIRDRVMEEI